MPRPKIRFPWGNVDCSALAPPASWEPTEFAHTPHKQARSAEPESEVKKPQAQLGSPRNSSPFKDSGSPERALGAPPKKFKYGNSIATAATQELASQASPSHKASEAYLLQHTNAINVGTPSAKAPSKPIPSKAAVADSMAAATPEQPGSPSPAIQSESLGAEKPSPTDADPSKVPICTTSKPDPAAPADEPRPMVEPLLAIKDQEIEATKLIFLGNYGSVEDSLAVEHFTVADFEDLGALQARLAAKIWQWATSIIEASNIPSTETCPCSSDQILGLLQMMPVTLEQLQALSFFGDEKLSRTSPKLNCGSWDMFSRWESRKNKHGGSTVTLSIRKSNRVKGSHLTMLGSWSLIAAEDGHFKKAHRPLLVMLAIRATFRVLNQPNCHVPVQLATGILQALKGLISEHE